MPIGVKSGQSGSYQVLSGQNLAEYSVLSKFVLYRYTINRFFNI